MYHGISLVQVKAWCWIIVIWTYWNNFRAIDWSEYLEYCQQNTCYLVNLSSIETGIFWYLEVNAIAANVLAPSVAKTLAAI